MDKILEISKKAETIALKLLDQFENEGLTEEEVRFVAMKLHRIVNDAISENQKTTAFHNPFSHSKN